MALATAAADGRPSIRHVLLRGIADRGFVFYTNHGSRKGTELAENPRAAFSIYWRELDRQISVTGDVSRVSEEESDAYFATRPREARLGAWASRQSAELASRDELMERFAAFDAEYPGDDVPRPLVLGRLPDRSDHRGVLAGPSAPAPRPVPVRTGGRRLDDPATLAVAGRLRSPMSDDEKLRERIAADMPRADRRARATGAHPVDGLPGLRPRQRSRVRRGDEGDPRGGRRARTPASSSWTAGIPPSSASSPDPRARPPSCSTRTTTCSPRVRSTSGTRRRSSRS